MTTTNYAKFTKPDGETVYFLTDEAGLGLAVDAALKAAAAVPRVPGAQPPRVSVFRAVGVAAGLPHVLCGTGCPPRDSKARCALAGQVSGQG